MLGLQGSKAENPHKYTRRKWILFLTRVILVMSLAGFGTRLGYCQIGEEVVQFLRLHGISVPLLCQVTTPT